MFYDEEGLERIARDIQARLDRGFDVTSKVAEGIDRSILTLSAGALVFSMTFVEKLAPEKLWLPLLFAAWICFTISLIAVILANCALQRALEKNTMILDGLAGRIAKLRQEQVLVASPPMPNAKLPEGQNPGVLAWNRLALGMFFLGVVCLGVFVAHNLLHEEVPNNLIGRLPTALNHAHIVT